MRLSISVMAHPARADQVAELVGSVGDVPVSWDTQGPPSSNQDRQWATGRGAWQLHDQTCDWHLVLQDDALPCRDMTAGLQNALSHVPAETAVAAYLGTKRPKGELVGRLVEQAELTGASWVETDELHWGVAICLPTRAIPAMLAWCDRKHGVAYDKRISRFVTSVLRWRVRCPWPSLVDHREGPSLWGAFDPEGRHAHRVVTGSALDVDWSGPVVSHIGQSREGRMSTVSHDPFAPKRVAHRVPATGTGTVLVTEPSETEKVETLQGVAPVNVYEDTPELREHIANREPAPDVDLSDKLTEQPEVPVKPTTRDSVALWRTYATAKGVDDAESMTKAQLMDRFRDAG